jgi:glycosyltransferase involved in cell wall biosynthesis
VGRYLREVLAGLFLDPRFGRVVLLGDREPLAAFAAEHGVAGRVTIHPFPRGWSGRRAQLGWAALAARGHTRADVWFFPFSEVPVLMHPRRSVVTVHDLIPLKVPELAGARLRLATRLALYTGAGLARTVISVSESTRRDIVEWMPGAAGKVEVVPSGVSPSFRPPSPAEAAECAPAAAYQPFILCVGNRYPHKNHRAAVDTLALLRAEGRPTRLVVAGGEPNSFWKEVVRHAESVGVADAVVDLGRVTDAELRCLYACCTAFLFPSFYEGFGFPVLEALACGAPVIASDRSSIPEVLGDAGFLVDPADPRAMAAAVRRLEEEPALRAHFVREGLEQASRFTWADTTKRTADILYRTAVT